MSYPRWSSFRHFIHAGATPRVTSPDPLQTEPSSLKKTKALQASSRITGTGGVKSAPGPWYDPVQRNGNKSLVKADPFQCQTGNE